MHVHLVYPCPHNQCRQAAGYLGQQLCTHHAVLLPELLVTTTVVTSGRLAADEGHVPTDPSLSASTRTLGHLMQIASGSCFVCCFLLMMWIYQL